MVARKLTLAAIRRVASALPGLQEGTSYGTPAWRHKGRLIARLHQDGGSLMLKVGFEARDHLARADPATFFITEHYRSYPSVLARAAQIDSRTLRGMLERHWQKIAPKKLKGAPR